MRRITISMAGTVVLLVGLIVLCVGLASGQGLPDDSDTTEIKMSGPIGAISCDPAPQTVVIAGMVSDTANASAGDDGGGKIDRLLWRG